MSEADSASPMPRRGRKGPSECSSRGAMPARGRARRRCGVTFDGEQHLVERGGLEDLALQRRGGGEQAHVDVGERVGEALTVGALQHGGELEQLEVACDAVGDVEVGVEPQLAEAPADAGDAVEHLLAQQLAACRRAGRRAVDLLWSACAWSPSLPVSPTSACDTGLGGDWSSAELPADVGHDGGEMAGEVAGAGVWRGAHEVDGERVQQLEAGALLGGVVGGEQRAPAHAAGARSAAR